MDGRPDGPVEDAETEGREIAAIDKTSAKRKKGEFKT
jgi:hypothetical protein